MVPCDMVQEVLPILQRFHRNMHYDWVVRKHKCLSPHSKKLSLLQLGLKNHRILKLTHFTLECIVLLKVYKSLTALALSEVQTNDHHCGWFDNNGCTAISFALVFLGVFSLERILDMLFVILWFGKRTIFIVEAIVLAFPKMKSLMNFHLCQTPLHRGILYLMLWFWFKIIHSHL